jgi:hypothetical protein
MCQSLAGSTAKLQVLTQESILVRLETCKAATLHNIRRNSAYRPECNLRPAGSAYVTPASIIRHAL